jgi:phage/plasmid-associated DNA primase
MNTPERVLAATQSCQSEQDPLADYLADRCVRGSPSLRVARNELLTDYLSWCQQTSEKFPLSRNALFDHVRGLPGVAETQWRALGQAAPVRGFTGIGLACANMDAADLGEIA